MTVTDFFKMFDYFGVQIDFNFKSQKLYKSVCGGLIFLMYVIICVLYVTYSAIPFLQKQHKTVIYYDKELIETDEINFRKYNVTFATNLVCDNYDGKFGEIYSKFKIVAKHVQYLKVNGTSKKIKTILPFHKCTYDDFHNQFNEELDRNEVVNNFNCINSTNYTIKGIFADEDFEYFEFTFSVNMEDDFDSQIYLDIFYEYDCKLSLFYIDTAVDVGNITHPTRSFLNSKFIQISPTDYKKMNLYYTIKNYKTDENWLFTLPKQENYLAFSSSEEYYVVKGDTRFKYSLDDCDQFARFFIRASTSRNIIERRYEKLTEFLASSVSILSAIFLLLVVILHRVNYSLALKEIVNTLCINQKKNLEEKIALKTKLSNIKNINKFKKQKKLNILKDENNSYEIEEISLTSNKLNKTEYPNKHKIKNAIEQIQGKIIKSKDNISYDNSQLKMNLSNNKNILNVHRINVEMNNCLINESKNESENYIFNTNGVFKNRYHDQVKKIYKNQDKTGFINKIINNNEDNQKNFRLSNGIQKIGLISNNKLLNFNPNEKYNTKIKNKLNFLNKNIHTSIINYKLCRHLKTNKNNYLGNSLNYITNSLDIFTYLKTLKNQDILINILYNKDNFSIYKKLESLSFNSNNIFDNIYLINNYKKKNSSNSDLDYFCESFIELINKTYKTPLEKRLIELIIREINDI